MGPRMLILLSTLEVVAGVARDAMPPFCNKFYFIRLLCNQSIIKFACKNTVLVWGQWSNDVVLAYRPCAFNREILREENLYAWLLRICTTCSVPGYRLPSITLTPRKAPVPSHVGICSSDAKLPIQPHKSKPNFPTRHSTFQYPCNFFRGQNQGNLGCVCLPGPNKPLRSRVQPELFVCLEVVTSPASTALKAP